MDFIYLRTFLEVARCGSFTKAAENLGYVQSSVTTHIQKLENEYGVVLFERFGRSMRLTSAGGQLLETFERILSLFDESKHLISRQVKGHVHIGTIESLIAYFLPPVFHRFRQLFPQINLQVQPFSEASILQSVRSGELDLGVMLDRRVEDDDVTAIPIRQETLVLVAQPGHKLVQTPSVTLEELDGQSMIVSEQGCAYRTVFEQLLARNGVTCRIHHEFGSLEAIKQCVGFGLGIALVPRIAVSRELEEGKLAALPFTHPDITFYTQILLHKKKWLSPAIRHLVDLLTAEGKAGA